MSVYRETWFNRRPTARGLEFQGGVIAGPRQAFRWGLDDQGRVRETVRTESLHE